MSAPSAVMAILSALEKKIWDDNKDCYSRLITLSQLSSSSSSTILFVNPPTHLPSRPSLESAHCCHCCCHHHGGEHAFMHTEKQNKFIYITCLQPLIRFTPSSPLTLSSSPISFSCLSFSSSIFSSYLYSFILLLFFLLTHPRSPFFSSSSLYSFFYFPSLSFSLCVLSFCFFPYFYHFFLFLTFFGIFTFIFSIFLSLSSLFSLFFLFLLL